MARYDADSFSELSDSATGRSSGLCFRASTRQIHFCKNILSDTIEAVEYDFGLRLSIMLGQVWSQTGHQALSDLIKAERDLFKTWWRQGHQGVHTFLSSIFGVWEKDSWT